MIGALLWSISDDPPGESELAPAAPAAEAVVLATARAAAEVSARRDSLSDRPLLDALTDVEGGHAKDSAGICHARPGSRRDGGHYDPSEVNRSGKAPRQRQFHRD